MQHTEKYQFNLIEGSDPFLPEALNENAVKTEAALEGHKAEVAQRLAEQGEALADRVRLVTGSYTGSGEYGPDHPTALEFPDAERPPLFILVSNLQYSARAVMIRGLEKTVSWLEGTTKHYVELTWTDKGVLWYSKESSVSQLNYTDRVYRYVAFL